MDDRSLGLPFTNLRKSHATILISLLADAALYDVMRIGIGDIGYRGTGDRHALFIDNQKRLLALNGLVYRIDEDTSLEPHTHRQANTGIQRASKASGRAGLFSGTSHRE